jgi:ATP-binding cassette subfamily F protein 3
LLKTCVEQFYLVFKHRIHPFDGDIDDYYQCLSQEKQILNKKSQASKEVNYKELKVLQNRIKKLEQLMQASEQKLAAITKELYDDSLYLPENASQLAHLQQEQALLKQTLSTHEAEWFQVHEHLENNND